jgi:hypothetical protein
MSGQEMCEPSNLERDGKSDPCTNQSKLGKHHSNNDMAAKSTSQLQRSWGDLTDKTSAPADDHACECDLTMPYSEIVTIAGVSDIPQLDLNGIDEVPPAPLRGRRSKIAAPKPKPTAVVSMVSPHKLLIVSEDFCELFRYSVSGAEICGRAVKMLQGPRTDPGIIVAGIKSAALASTTRSDLTLYTGGGEELELRVTFSPYVCGDDTLAGCLLEVEPPPATAAS